MATREFIVPHPFESDRRGPIRWILSHVRRHPLIILMVLLGSLGNAALAAAIPLFTGRAFDAVAQQPERARDLVLAAGIAIVLSQSVRALLLLGRNFGAELLGQRLERDTRDELYGTLLGKSMRFHDQQRSGEMMARATNDVHELALMFSPGFNLVIGSGNFLIVPLLLAPRYDPRLVLVPALFIVGYAIALAVYLRQLSPVTAAVRRTFGTMNAQLTESIEGIETVKGAAREVQEATAFRRAATEVRDSFVRQGRLEARFYPLLLLGIAIGAAFGHALLLFREGAISVGDVVAYVELIALFGFPVFTSLLAYSQLSSGVSSARRLLELMEEEQEIDEMAGGHDAPMRGAIRFEGATFRYKSVSPQGEIPQRDALHEISFEVAPGETIAVVGQTGAGKSTLAKLLNRTYDVDAGRVLVDGVDVRDWNLASLRRQISIIEQDIFLFSRSVRENIAFGRPDASEEEVEAAARAAQAHDFIMEMPEGYATVVGERGMMLSGGQRQRLALARAFLTQPAILVLDDSTSAIDSATEDQIQRAIRAAAEGRTTILITHRLSQIRHADKIVVLRQGRVAAVGTHEELLAQSQPYRNIFARYEK